MNLSPVVRSVVIGVAMTASACVQADEPAKTTVRKESFDRDPRWDGQNNRVVIEKPVPIVQDFGYSRTNHAGKAAGEIGGRIQRSNTSAFYGLRLAQPKSLADKLRCSGSLALVESGGTSCLYFGWFNTKTPGSRPYNWMGLCLSGEKTGACVVVGYRTAGGNAGGPGRVTGFGPGWYAKPKIRDIHLIPDDGTRYAFDFQYDPAANDGLGQITFTLGGKGPYTGGPFVYKMPAEHRASGAIFDAFGIVNAQTAGGALTAYFDDLVIDGQFQSFDIDPQWVGQGNRAQHDDYGREGAHQFGFTETAYAGGIKGEIGGLMYSSSTTPGYYAADVGRLTLEDRLIASGKVALTQYGSDGGMFLGWFDSKKRGNPPANVLGVFIAGPTSTGPRFRGCVASSDPKAAHTQRDTAAPIAPDGAAHDWRIEYDPAADGGKGRIIVRLGDHEDSFPLPPGVRKNGAMFDRFGLFVHEGGGRASQVYLDDLQYTASLHR